MRRRVFNDDACERGQIGQPQGPDRQSRGFHCSDQLSQRARYCVDISLKRREEDLLAARALNIKATGMGTLHTLSMLALRLAFSQSELLEVDIRRVLINLSAYTLVRVQGNLRRQWKYSPPKGPSYSEKRSTGYSKSSSRSNAAAQPNPDKIAPA